MKSKFSAQVLYLFFTLFLSSMKSVASTTTDSAIDFQGYDQQKKEISEMTINLPVCTQANCKNAKHELFASNGCYQWSISHPHLIKMSENRKRGSCVDSVLLTPLIMKESKTLVSIKAKDISSGLVLESQAKVGELASLAININYHHLHVNDKKHIDVVGFDDQGSIFTSLDGFRFDVSILEGSQHIKMTQKPDGYKHKRVNFQQSTDIFYFKGLNPGEARLKISCLEPGYEKIQPVEVTILIIDPFVLEPHLPQFLLPTTKFDFKVQKLNKQDNGEVIKQEVKFPTPQYEVQVSDPTLSVINQKSEFFSSIYNGTQTITVIDKKMQNNTAELQVNIVFPYQLTMNIHDVTDKYDPSVKLGEDLSFGIDDDSVGETRILVEEHFYLITLQLYCKDGNRINLTPNVLFANTGLDKNFIEVVKTNQIGSQLLIKTRVIEKDQETLKTTYSFVKVVSQLDGEQWEPVNRAKLSLDAELVVTKPVKIMYPNDYILLPFNQNEGQVLQTYATGGSGLYTWSVQDPEVVQIEGTVSILSKQVGNTTLTVKDLRNSHNLAQISVQVAYPAKLKWLEEQLELMSGDYSSTIGEKGVLNVIALDKNGRKFSNCTSLQFDYKTKAENLRIEPYQKLSYFDLQNYVKNSFDLLSLKHQFDNNPSVFFSDELPKTAVIPTADKINYNNFGICEQVPIFALQEGLARVKVQHKIKQDEQKVVESEHTEIAIYKKLQTIAPVVSEYFTDLESRDSQLGQEFQNFDSFFNENLMLLTTGAHMIWHVSGGTNFWQEYTDMYSVQWDVNSQVDKKDYALVISLLESRVTEFDVQIYCQAVSDQQSALSAVNKVEVVMKQSSKQSKLLLRPAQHEIKLNVECSGPKSARLLWAQGNDDKQVLAQSRIQQNQLVHFVQTESEHFVRGVLFNADDLAYQRSSSVFQQLTADNNQLVEIDFIDSTFEAAQHNSTYDKRVLKFGSNTGELTLKLDANSFINSGLNIKPVKGGYFSSAPEQVFDKSSWQVGELVSVKTDVVDTMKIHVVNKMQVTPTYKSLYLGTQDTFTINIVEGSGFFSVTTDTNEIIELVHKDRQITILPKNNVGQVKIKVEDIMFPDSEPIYAHVLVSEISKLMLWSPQSLMEQGDSVTLKVSAYDSEGQEFDQDQYQNMQFSIETEMTGVIERQYGLKTESTNINTEFKSIGIEPGIYQLTAHSHLLHQLNNKGSRDSNLLSSDMIRIEVFPQLQIYPSELLLTPNMKYTLQIVGGPHSSVQSFSQGSSIEIKFDIEQNTVAQVDQNREVTGLQVGDASLRYMIIQHRVQKSPPSSNTNSNEEEVQNTVISKHYVPIRVRLVTSIEIPQSSQRQIYSDSLIKMITVLKYNNEIFSHGVAPLSYHWQSSDQRVVQLQLPVDIPQKAKSIWNGEHKKEQLFQTYFNSSSVYANAGKSGESVISLTVAIEYTPEYTKEKNWFETSSNLKVASQLQVSVNQYSSGLQATTHSYLLPPHSTGYIKTNIDSKLKLGYSTVSVYDHSTNSYKNEEAKSPIVKLVDNKGIQTMEKYGKVTVVVEQGGEQFSDQVAMVNVYITDIFSIQIMEAYQVLQMPLGSTFTLPIHFQNEHAVRFASEIDGVKLSYGLSHPKVLSISINERGQTVQVQAQGSGDCSLKIYLESNPEIFDEVKIRVSSLVRPLSPVNLHIGGAVEFKLFKPDEFGESDKKISWRSSDPYTLQIQSESGKAQALKEGKVDVMLNNHMNAASIVHVNRIQFGQVDQQKALILETDEIRSGNRIIKPDDLKVRVKLYFNKNSEEVLPTIQYEGVTLIKHNVGISCETDYPDFVTATAETNDILGFFCNLSYRQEAELKQMPRFVKVSVFAFGMLPGQSLPVYNEKIAIFEVQLLSSIKIEKKYQNGIDLHSGSREQVVRILSSTDFKVELESGKENLVKFQVTRQNTDSNDYSLAVVVPNDVNQDFETNLVISHPFTKQTQVLPIKYTRELKARAAADYSNRYNERPKSSQSYQAKEQEPDFGERKYRHQEQSQDSWTWSSFIIVLLLSVVSIFFVKKQFQSTGEEERQPERQNRIRQPGYRQNLNQPRLLPQSYPVKNPHYYQQAPAQNLSIASNNSNRVVNLSSINQSGRYNRYGIDLDNVNLNESSGQRRNESLWKDN